MKRQEKRLEASGSHSGKRARHCDWPRLIVSLLGVARWPATCERAEASLTFVLKRPTEAGALCAERHADEKTTRHKQSFFLKPLKSRLSCPLFKCST